LDGSVCREIAVQDFTHCESVGQVPANTIMVIGQHPGIEERGERRGKRKEGKRGGKEGRETRGRDRKREVSV
jgi:hypothetical protein